MPLENGNPPIYFATANGPDKVKYHLEISIQQGRYIKTLKTAEQTIEKPTGEVIISYQPEKLGVEVMEVNLTELLFASEEEEKPEEVESMVAAKDQPKHVTIKLTHGDRTFAMRADADSKKTDLCWLVAKDDKPIRCEIVAEYSKAPRRRYYYRNEEPDLRKGPGGLILNVSNADFVKK